jgi:predicted secreted protein
MTTEATIGYGAQFKRGNADGPPETYTAIGEVLDIKPLSMSKDTVDATHMGSPDGYREFISALRDGGEVEVTVNFVPGAATFFNALADFNADSARSYRVEWADGSTWDFEGIMTAPAVETPLDDKMTATFTYKVTGKPVLTQ